MRSAETLSYAALIPALIWLTMGPYWALLLMIQSIGFCVLKHRPEECLVIQAVLCSPGPPCGFKVVSVVQPAEWPVESVLNRLCNSLSSRRCFTHQHHRSGSGVRHSMACVSPQPSNPVVEHRLSCVALQLRSVGMTGHRYDGGY